MTSCLPNEEAGEKLSHSSDQEKSTVTALVVRLSDA